MAKPTRKPEPVEWDMLNYFEWYCGTSTLERASIHGAKRELDLLTGRGKDWIESRVKELRKITGDAA